MERKNNEAITSLTGTVIRTQNSFYYIVPQINEEEFDIKAQPISCKLRGIFKKNREIVTIGDRVEYTLLADGSGVIEKLLPRRSLMRRPLVANIDQAFLIFAAKDPDPQNRGQGQQMAAEYGAFLCERRAGRCGQNGYRCPAGAGGKDR